jgi:hypothetical protein
MLHCILHAVLLRSFMRSFDELKMIYDSAEMVEDLAIDNLEVRLTMTHHWCILFTKWLYACDIYVYIYMYIYIASSSLLELRTTRIRLVKLVNSGTKFCPGIDKFH